MAHRFTYEGLIDIRLAYGPMYGNALATHRIYEERFPGRRLPNSRIFTSVDTHIRGTGSVIPQVHDRGRPHSVRDQSLP